MKNSTGNHKGKNNSYHKMTAEQKLAFAKAGNAVVNSQSHLYTEKKSKAMFKKLDDGYRISKDAGWGTEYKGKQNLKISSQLHTHLMERLT